MIVTGSFFLTGSIWARTVFCIDIGIIVFIHMVKINLPHMYMVFVPFFIKKMKYFRQSEPEAFERDSQHEGAKTYVNGVNLGISIAAR